MATKVILLLLGVCFGMISCQSFPCQVELGGDNYDFSNLVAQNGSYLWTAMLNGTNMMFQVQLCGAVKPMFASCASASPVNVVSMDSKTCTALGDPMVYSWDLTPYDDGVRLTFYHGDAMDNIAFYSATLYLLCNPAVTMTDWIFEHERVCTDNVDGLDLGGYFHFKTQTKYACPGSVLLGN